MSKKSSPCLYMVIGCAVAAGLAIAAVVGIGAFVAHKGKQFAEGMADPKIRGEKVMAVLGAETLPEGYYPMFSFSVPFAFEMAMLSDQPPAEDGSPQDIDESGFIYIDGRIFGDQRQNLIDYLEGRADDLDMMESVSVDLDNNEVLRRGSFELEGHRHLYAAFRGQVNTGDDAFDGIQVLTYVDCGDSRVRLGIWFGPDPLDGAEANAGELELEGTPADERALIEFFRPLQPCVG